MRYRIGFWGVVNLNLYTALNDGFRGQGGGGGGGKPLARAPSVVKSIETAAR